MALVEDGMVLGLGTGSTATLAVDALGQRVKQGLRIVGVPTSEHTAAQARGLGIPISSLGEQPELDLTIDGADEIQRGTLHLIKGRGGALLREKMVASASRRLIIIADDTKLVDRLGAHFAVPVEVVQFGWQSVERRLQKLGAKLVKWNADGKHQAVVDHLGAQLQGICAKLPAGDAQRSNCDGVFKAPAKA